MVLAAFILISSWVCMVLWGKIPAMLAVAAWKRQYKAKLKCGNVGFWHGKPASLYSVHISALIGRSSPQGWGLQLLQAFQFETV